MSWSNDNFDCLFRGRILVVPDPGYGPLQWASRTQPLGRGALPTLIPLRGPLYCDATIICCIATLGAYGRSP